MHDLAGAADRASKGVADALVAQAYAQRGVFGPKKRMTSFEMPALRGVPGPGDTTIFSGDMAAMSSMVVWSLRSTRTSAPSSLRYWYRLYVKLS